MAEGVVFYVFGGLAVVGSLFMITRHNPVACAMSLVVVLFSLSVMYLALHAPFVAIMQIIVYAGAVMVLFLYVIMLLNLSDEELGRTVVTPLKVFGGFMGILFLAALSMLLWGELGRDTAVKASFGGVVSIGNILFSKYLLPFEVTSVLLLSAIVGAVVIAQKDKD